MQTSSVLGDILTRHARHARHAAARLWHEWGVRPEDRVAYQGLPAILTLDASQTSSNTGTPSIAVAVKNWL